MGEQPLFKNIIENLFNISGNTVRGNTVNNQLTVNVHRHQGWRLKWNAPVVLIFSALILTVHLSYRTQYSYQLREFFSIPREFLFGNIEHYLRATLFVFGHQNWNELASNLTLILLIGPITEERYGSLQLVVMILLTALISGLVQSLLFGGGVIGASCIVYMLMLAASFVNTKKGEIPITFIIVMIVYVFGGLSALSQHGQESLVPQIVGGLCGAAFVAWGIARKVEST
jgi:membrane associated rhomboid family serine protease